MVRRLCGLAAARSAASGGLTPRIVTVQSDFVFRCLMQTTMSMPPAVQRTLMQLDGDQELVRGIG